MQEKKIAVFGAGIAGLTCAYYFKRMGANPVVFEATDRPGGNIWTVNQDGWLVERGPATLRGKNPELIQLVADLELAEKVVGAQPEAKARYIVRDGRLRALPSGPAYLLTSRALSFAGKLRLLREPFVRAPSSIPASESLHDFAARRFGREVADFLINPFVAGIYAGDPKRLIAGQSFPDLPKYEREHGSVVKGFIRSAKTKKRAQKNLPAIELPGVFSFRDGMQTLTDALAASLEAEIKTGAAVVSFRKEGKQWRVKSTSGEEKFDAVVSTLPLPALLNLKFPFADDKFRQLATQIAYPPVATLALGFEADAFKRKPDGFGFLVPEKENLKLLGAQFNSNIFPGRTPNGRVLMTAFLGGMRHPDFVDQPFDQLKATALKELDALFGLRDAPVFESYFCWPKSIPQYGAAHEELVAAFGKLSSDNPGLYFSGNYLQGISVPDTVKHAKATALKILENR